MKSKIRNITVGFLVTFVFIGGFGNSQEVRAKDAKAAADPAKVSSDTVSHKVLAFNLEGLNEKGAKKWDVKGESAEAVSENEVKLDNIVASAYGEEAEAVITADEGVYDRAKNNVKLEKNVHATIEATKGFTGDFVEGSGQIKDNSKADSVKPAKSKKSKTLITCDGEVQFDYEKNQAYFMKNVVVTSEDGTIESDKLTIYLDPTTRRLKEIVADGNVTIIRGGNTSFSQRATYSEIDKKVTLSGRPRLVFTPDGDAGFDSNLFGETKK